MADNDNNNTGSEIFNAEKPSRLKRAFQAVGGTLSTITGDGFNYGWDQAGLTYDYAKTWLGSKGIGLAKPAA